MATCMGQSFQFEIEVIREKNGPSEFLTFDLALPYNMDGVVVNLPAMMAGLPQDKWMSEFIPAPVVEEEEEELPTDEFDLGGDL